MLKYYAIIMFVVIFVFFVAIFIIVNEKKKEKERIKNFFEENEKVEVDNKTISRNLSNVVSKISFSDRYRENIRNKLVRGNMPLSFEEFLVFRILLIVFIGLITLLLTKNFIIVIILAVITWLLPMGYLKMKYNKRLKQFNEQLSDSIRIISSSLKAGYSYMQAIKTLVKEMPDPISGEFSFLLKEMSLGVETSEALTHLNKRMGSEDLSLMITAMLIQQETGGNLAEILDTISLTIQERVKIKGEIRTLTTQGKLTGLIVAFMPVIIVVFMILVNPAYGDLLINTTSGRILIAISVISELIGIYFVRKIINIEF